MRPFYIIVKVKRKKVRVVVVDTFIKGTTLYLIGVNEDMTITQYKSKDCKFMRFLKADEAVPRFDMRTK